MEKKKPSRDKPTLPFHFRDEQTGVQRGEVSAIVIRPVCEGATNKHHCFLLVMRSTIEGWYPWTSVHEDKRSAQVSSDGREKMRTIAHKG